MKERISSVYEGMTDRDIEYSLERIETSFENAAYAFMASKAINEYMIFSRAQQKIDEVFYEYEVAFEEACHREGIDESKYVIDQEELASEINEILEGISFDKIGLKGIANSLK